MGIFAIPAQRVGCTRIYVAGIAGLAVIAAANLIGDIVATGGARRCGRAEADDEEAGDCEFKQVRAGEVPHSFS
jgi:hypothetical protein